MCLGMTSMLEQDESDSRLPGYCSLGLFLSRGQGYDLSVAYFGNTYKWYRVDVFGPDGLTCHHEYQVNCAWRQGECTEVREHDI